MPTRARRAYTRLKVPGGAYMPARNQHVRAVRHRRALLRWYVRARAYPLPRGHTVLAAGVEVLILDHAIC